MTEALDLPPLLESWILHLRAERKSRETLKNYRTGVRQYLAWCEEACETPRLDRGTVNAFVAHLLDSGKEAATAVVRQLAVRRFSTWLFDEGEIPVDLLHGLKRPKIDQKLIHPLSIEQLQAMLRACSAKTFWDRRDEAILRLMQETGVRASELVDMTVDAVDLTAGMATVERGKGGKGRVVPLSHQAGKAVDRYLRLRRSHRLASTPKLWLGCSGKGFTYGALYCTLQRRAEVAGVADFHPHRLRHTMATRWLANGGSEGGLMAVAGWSRRDMIDRYTRATASERAATEARGLGLGDI